MWADYTGKQFDQNKAAEQVYAFARDKRSVFRKTPLHHVNCRGDLETYYCEDRLYIVRCTECGAVALVTARGPEDAARKTLAEE